MPAATANDAQNLLVTLGFSPVQPVMPAWARTKDALKCLEAVLASDAYRSLLADRDAGTIDGPEFKNCTLALIEKMEKTGAFDGLADG